MVAGTWPEVAGSGRKTADFHGKMKVSSENVDFLVKTEYKYY